MTDEEHSIIAGIKSDVKEIQHKLDEVEKMLHGDEGRFGFLQKVNIIWSSIIVWPLCTLSAGAGVVATLMIQKWMR